MSFSFCYAEKSSDKKIGDEKSDDEKSGDEKRGERGEPAAQRDVEVPNHCISQNSVDPVGSNIMEEVRGAPNKDAASKQDLCQTMEPLAKATNDIHESLSSARPGDPDYRGCQQNRSRHPPGSLHL